MDIYKSDMNLYSIDLKELYNSLVLKGKSVYTVVSMPEELGTMQPNETAQLVKFTRNLGVYHDSKRGYQILRLDKFKANHLELHS